MAQDEGNKEDKFDFTEEGEAQDFLTLDQARFAAMQMAREERGSYGQRWQNVPMVFEVVGAEETEDDYALTLSFRPEGDFAGDPGREQFVFRNKIGRVAFRQVLSLPTPEGRKKFPILPVAIGLAAVIAALAIVMVLTTGGPGGGENGETLAAGLVPTATPAQSNKQNLEAVTPLPVAPAAITVSPTPTSLATDIPDTPSPAPTTSMLTPTVAVSPDSTTTAVATPIAPGSLSVKSDPTGAAIFLNGQDTGQSSPYVFIDLTPGTYTLELRLPNYQKSEVTAIVLVSGETNEASIVLPPEPSPTPTTSPTRTRIPVPTPTLKPGDDHGDFPANSTPIAVFGTVSGAIGTTTDEDYFSFTAQKDQIYALEIDERDLNTTHRLFDSDGITMLSNFSTSRLEWTAKGSGTYFVKVSAQSKGKMGDYRLTLAGSTTLSVPTPTLDAGDDHGDFPVNATPIAVFGTATGTIGTTTDEDFFSFTAQKGQIYALEIDERDLNTTHRLFDSDGITMLSNFSTSRLEWTAKSSGTYYVKVSAQSKGKMGDYSVTLSQQVSG